MGFRQSGRRRGMFKLIVLLFALCAVSGAVTLFEDYFDGTAEGWTEFSTDPDSANYYVESGWYHMELFGTDPQIFALNGDDATTEPHIMSIPDYSFYCKSKAWSPTWHVGFGARFTNPISNSNGYALWLRYADQDVVLMRHDEELKYTILAICPFTLVYEQEYWIRFALTGGVLQCKVWQGSIGDEPVAWLLEAYDATIGGPGSIGMGSACYGTLNNHAAFDSVIVNDPLALESDTWGAIKASF